MAKIPSQWFTAINNNNASFWVNGVKRVPGFNEWGEPVPVTVNNGDLMEILPDEGFQVMSASYLDDWGQPNDFEINNGIASLVFGSGGISTLSLIVEQATEGVTGANKIYVVDNDTIKEVNNARFFYSSGTDGTPVSVDLGTFIIGLIKVPVDIPQDMILSPEPILLGGKNTGINAPVVDREEISVDLGTIEVPPTYNNARDYEGVNFFLHLPFAPSVKIDADYVVGETIHIEYLIELYSGMASINISSSKVNGEVFLSRKVDLGVNVPFGLSGLSTVEMNNSNIGVVGDNNIRTPFIERIEHEAFLADGEFSTVITDEGNLIGETGFIVVDEIKLSVSGYGNESDMIKSELKQGVIIQ